MASSGRLEKEDKLRVKIESRLENLPPIFMEFCSEKILCFNYSGGRTLLQVSFYDKLAFADLQQPLADQGFLW